ncbi:translocation/assembly module TamB domain-containing protein [Pleurocapsa sp. PCC 7319]|uniref:translocation/assembly module TamB domain-containing protein n=1 Tax=Pleurocapsa sp. PCC 7319 TaxID=118161 RepID=UPI00034AB4E5|nr:translocation/assembly module TamB domain-containing protein [Pleurocapsa sp. PCC 7319]
MNKAPNTKPEQLKSEKGRITKVFSSPKTLATGAIAIATFGSLGYWGVQVLVRKKLPPFLEDQIGKFIERPLDLGEVQSFSLSGIEFGKTVIHPTDTDTDKVIVEGLKVGFNLIPVLFRRTLPLDVTLIQPDVYLEQEKDGEWVNLDFLQSDPNKEKKDPLIYFDVNLDIEQADITAVPYEQNPLQVKVDGSGRFNQKEEFLDYDLDAAIEQAKATIQGETKLQTGTTDTKLLVKDLALTDVATLLPNSPVNLDSGQLNADLDINIPSFEEITAANIKGIVNLQNVTGEATDLNSAVTAKSKLSFSGRNAEVKETQASLGDITARVDGQVNLDSGYDLDLDILPFALSSLPKNIIQQLPVPVKGVVEAQVQLQGAIKEPQLIGRINNTRTVIIDKTTFKEIDAKFKADLNRVVLENVQIIPLAGGEVTAEGSIDTNLQQALNSKQGININQMPLDFSFQANLPTQKLVSPYYQLPQNVAVGNFQAEGKIDGTVENPEALVNWNIPETSTNNQEDIAGSGEVVFMNNNLFLRDTEITYGDGQADLEAEANLDNQQWQANLDANSLNLTPFLKQFNNPNLNLNRPVAVNTAQAKFNGRLDQLDLNQIQGTADLNLSVDGGNVILDSQLNSGNLQAKAVTNNIQLDNFVTSLPVATSLQSGEINASGKLKQILALKDNPDFNSIDANANLDLNVDGEAVAVSSRLNSGRVQASANTSQINLNRVLPDLPIPASVQSSQVTASGELKQLLSFVENPNLSTVEARVDADLEVAEGNVQAIANLNNNQWQANVDANNVSSQLLLDQFAPSNLASVELDDINAQADLTGDINPLINNEVNIPIAINQFTVNSGAQNVNAQGDLTLADITSNLDVTDTNLDVAANLDFDRLPIDQVIAASTQDNQLIAESVNISGQAAFDGQFQGKQLLTEPNEPGNVNLTGDLRLLDFAYNDIAFDPIMTGKVNIQPGEEIALNLKGEQDVIAARAVPCTDSNCQLPYLPTNLELRQGEDTEQPVIATGDRTGDLFSLDIQNFPLALLNLAPAKTAGIEGALKGKTTGNVDLNLYTLAAEGDINIANPGVGYIEANQLDASFNYDPADNIAEITSSSLDLKNSKYQLNAALDLQSGAIDGKLAIPEAYIQDVLTTLRWFTVEDVTDLFNIPDYAEPAAIKPAPEKDTVDQSIARKLNKLRQVNRQIQAKAAARETGGVPTELDIRGKYVGEILLGGTIQTPEADFKVEGKNWQWQPEPAYPDIVEPLGLVKEEAQFIALPKLSIAGELQGTTVDLEKAELQVQEAVLSLEGKLSPEQEDLKFAIANLTVDNIGNFVDIPVDLAGEINAIGTIKGTPTEPKLAGKVAFSNGAFNGNILPAKIAGKFDYDGSQLAFNTTAPEAIKVDATVPYPIIPGKSDRLNAKVNLEKEAFVFLSALSQNYLNWINGEGDAQLQASARLDLAREGVIYDLAANGVVNLEDAAISVETPFFTEPFVGTGKITLNNQIVNVEALDATFAQKDLSVAGKLPLLTAVQNLDNPLTVDISEGQINIDQLYKGGIAGKVNVTGAAMEPFIGGEVSLENGRVSIPKTETTPTEDSVQIAKNKTTNISSRAKALTKAQPTTPKASTSNSSFVTTLNNFKVNLKDFDFEQAPLYQFKLNGNLTLNGTVDKPDNIIPQGTLMLTRADVDLFSSRFNLARNRENTIVFTPEAGVFNPALDIVLRTEVEDLDEQELNNFRTVESNSNEIDDPISAINNSRTVRINLAVNGETAEILPNLAQDNFSCNIRPINEPIVENKKYYTQAELNRLTQCFNQLSLETGGNRDLINSSAVELTSIPSLDQGEILNLLSGQFVAFAQDVSNKSQSELFSLGVNRFIVDPIIDSVLYKVEDTTVSFGKKIGLDYLTVYPDLEGIYEINQDSSVRSTYDYVLNEARIEYQRNF